MTLDISVAGASAYSVSDTEVIGDYILYWVRDPVANQRNNGTLCTIYLVAWKEGWVEEVRLCSPLTPPPLISASMYMVSFIASLNTRGRVRFRPVRAIGRDHPADPPPRTSARTVPTIQPPSRCAQRGTRNRLHPLPT